MIRTCEGYEERWTQAACSVIVKSERASHREENESGDDESRMEKDPDDDTVESNARTGKTNFMTDFYYRSTAVPLLPS